jgi:NAD(P)-dependent dehydrogenase (short-subunit alcohol dehydrogenase family)
MDGTPPPATGAADSLWDGALLAGRIAIVTGGAHGIGRGIAVAFARQGARVAIVDIDTAGGAAVVDKVASEGGEAFVVEADVLDRDVAHAVVAQVVDLHGGVDVLVNNVGHFLFPAHPFVDSTDEEWDALFEVNLGHVLRMTRAVLPSMIERGGGSIINLSTVEAFRGIPQHPVYAACKAGVVQFGRSLAVEVARHGIRVNDIAPDVTRSKQLPYERWLSPEDEARVPTWVPLGRLGEASDPAGVAVFLASELSAFVTGSTIHCDGGTGAAGGWYPTSRGKGGWTNRPRDP